MLTKRYRKVEMQLTNGPTVQGVLRVMPRHPGGHYVLWAPKVVTGEGSTESLAGHMEIPRERVLFFTVLG